MQPIKPSEIKYFYITEHVLSYIDVNRKKEKEANDAIKIGVLYNTWEATLQFLIENIFKITFSNCKKCTERKRTFN